MKSTEMTESAATPDNAMATAEPGVATPRIVELRYAGKTARISIRDAAEHIQRQIASTRRFYEQDLLSFLFHTAMPGAVLVDVGANIGNHTIFFAAIVGARVVAFEPVADTAAHLRENVGLNNCGERVEVHEMALWSREGRGRVVMPQTANSGTAHIEPSSEGKVHLIRLDRLKLPRVDILKIDVEGAEPEVLRGASRTLRRQRPMLVVECMDDAAFQKVAALVEPLGYSPLLRFCVTPTYVFSPLSSLRNRSKAVARGSREQSLYLAATAATDSLGN